MGLLETAKLLAPSIRDASRSAEEQACLPSDLVEVLRDKGCFTALVPAALGGADLSLDSYLEFVEEMACSDASVGWCVMVASAMAGTVAAFSSDEATKAVFEGGTPIVGGQTSPQAKVVPEEGGLRVEGDFRFGSTCQYVDWFLVGFLREASPEPVHCLALIPKEAVRVDGDWNVFGLSGTGSINFHIEPRWVSDAFIFEHNAHDALRGSPRNALGLVTLMVTGHIGVALGVAKRALEELKAMTAWKHTDGVRLVDRPDFHVGFARATAQLRSIRALSLQAIRSAEAAADEERIQDSHRTDIRLVGAYATEVAREIVRSAFDFAGAPAIGKDSAVGRVFRDMHAASQHIIIAPSQYNAVGQLLLDRPVPPYP